jgi:serine/threonine protein kinase
MIEKKMFSSVLPYGLKCFEERYVLGKKLGTGAFACVYDAFDTYTGSPVACKLPHKKSSIRQQNSVITEANLLGSLKHTALPSIYDVGVLADGRPYFSMSLIQGETLEKKLQSGSLSALRGIKVLAQLSEILEEVYEQGVLHCDLKPANILIDAQDEVSLIDWGTAEYVEHSEEENYSLKGTPLYIAPELIRGGKRTLASEQYALGVMLYEMLTKHFPFFEENLCSLFSKVCFQEPKLPSHFESEVPITATLEGLSLKLLSKSKEERFSSMAVFRKELFGLSILNKKST